MSAKIETCNGHRVHDSLPSGFSYANDLQSDEYNRTGSVNGAAKVIYVRGYTEGNVRLPYLNLAVRLRPPMSIDDVRSNIGAAGMLDAAQYRTEYEKGWARAKRTDEYPSGGSGALEDGYLDQAAGRPKWHLAHCTDHDHCGEG